MKNRNENAMLPHIAHELISFFSSFSVSARRICISVSAENRSAFMPSHIAWPSDAKPAHHGHLKIGYLSESRASGFSSVTISPFALRTATQ